MLIFNMRTISDLKKEIYKKISNLSYKGRFICSIIGLIIVIIITFIFTSIFNNDTFDIDYNNISGYDVYALSSIIYDNDLYAVIKVIADNFIIASSQIDINKNSIEDIYDYCLLIDYKNSINKKDFINTSKYFYDNVSKKYSSTGDILPDSITQYRENYYIVRYITYDENANEEESYLGIALSPSNKKYYIWYLE